MFTNQIFCFVVENQEILSTDIADTETPEILGQHKIAGLVQLIIFIALLRNA